MHPSGSLLKSKSLIRGQGSQDLLGDLKDRFKRILERGMGEQEGNSYKGIDSQDLKDIKTRGHVTLTQSEYRSTDRCPPQVTATKNRNSEVGALPLLLKQQHKQHNSKHLY